MSGAFRLLQQFLNTAEFDAGTQVEGLRPNHERFCRLAGLAWPSEASEGVVHRLFQGAPTPIGCLLKLRGDIFIE